MPENLNKGDLLYPSHVRPLALLSCHSSASETTLRRKVPNRLSTSDLSDHLHGFRGVRTAVHATADSG